MSFFCFRCTAIIEEAIIKKVPQQSGHHNSLLDFKQAVDDGCCLCIELWYCIHDIDPSWLAPQPSSSMPDIDTSYLTRPAAVMPMYQKPNAGAIDIILSLKKGEGYTGPLPTIYFTAIPTKIAEQYLAPFAQANTTSKRMSIEQARNWLSNCLSSHEVCSRVRTEYLPTRLVAVQKIKDQLCARVCHSVELPPLSQYLTLSHIWGKLPILTLKKDNILRFKESIPIHYLPQVFQDAMLITHELGYNYLWIDSLCIIQDSDGGADWLRECPRMYQVYGNGVCNLAATGFESGQEGLLPVWQTDEILPPRFERCSSSEEEPNSSYHLILASDWTTEIERAPLHGRGWVCQEQIMAPRILHFTEKQIHWECYATKACEVFPSQLPPYGWSDNNFKNKFLILSKLSEHLNTDDMYREWLELVKEYSRANLTYANDKLPALSGLAKAFSKRLQDDYLAGLWKNDLLRGILWRGTMRSTAVTTYRAPSWSWASVDGFLTCDSLLGHASDWKPLAHILSADTTALEAGDVTGQVVGGFIKISGPLREVAIEGNMEKYFSWFNFEPRFTSETRDSTTRQAILHCDKNYNLDWLALYPSVHDWVPIKKVFLMPLLRGYREERNVYVVFGLVLAPERANGQYIKTGTFRTDSDKNLQSLFFGGHAIEDRFYEQYDGKHRYTIRIV